MTQRITNVFPVRIIKTEGEVSGAENLICEKPIAITFHDQSVCTLTKDGNSNPYVLLDFGKEYQGGVRIAITRASQKTHTLRIVLGESVTEALSSVGEKGATNDHSPRDFTATVSNMGICDLGRSGFRFARIELASEGYVSLKTVTASHRTENCDQTGFIKTSDGELNRILDTAIYTAFVCAQDGFIYDGIKRDRLVWSGDLNTEILTLSYTYGCIENIKNSLIMLRNETPSDRWMNNIPTYSLWWVLNLCDYVMLSGDVAFYDECRPYVSGILANLDRCTDEGGHADFSRGGMNAGMEFFLDWQSFKTENAKPGALSLIVYCLKKLLALGRCEQEEAELVRSIIYKLSPNLKVPVTMKQTRAMQIMAGAGTDGAREFLENGGAEGFSTFMMYFIMKAGTAVGADILPLAKRYYSAMLDRGATTFWEDFDINWLEGSGRIDEINDGSLSDIHADYGAFCYKNLRHSLCHGWSSGIVAWAFEELLGLKVLEPGFRKISISPDLSATEYIEAAIPTPRGVITVSAKRGEEPIVSLPDGIILDS